MRENSFYFNFSDFEGFGLPPLEAMSLGLVIFTFPNEGVKSYCNKKIPSSLGSMITVN